MDIPRSPRFQTAVPPLCARVLVSCKSVLPNSCLFVKHACNVRMCNITQHVSESAISLIARMLYGGVVSLQENDPCEDAPIHTIVLDASSINQLDASAIDMLILVAKSYDERGVSILCANWKGPQVRSFVATIMPSAWRTGP